MAKTRPAGIGTETGYRRRTLATLAVLSLVLVACSGGSDEGELSAGSGGPKGPALVKAPLTGLLVSAEVAARPAVSVKIENSAPSRPQGGLESADVVFELIVEGGVTRFLAVFHSVDADAGPIRSVRPADPSVASPFGGVVAFSGGIQRFVNAMRAAPVTAIDETSAGRDFRRRTDRAAPHNLYGRTEALRDRAGSGKPPPALGPFLEEGDAFAPAGASAVTGLDLAVGRTQVGYTWDGSTNTWKRTTNGTAHLVESGAQVAPTTVIVQFVDHLPSGEVDTTGTPVSEAQVVGRGTAVIFSAGQAVAAQWSKASATAMTVFSDAAGIPIALPPGRTWVEMPQVGASLVRRLPPPPPAGPVG